MEIGGRRDVIVVVFDGVVLLDLAGPLQVLHSVDDYRVRVASPDGWPVRTDIGVAVGADVALAEVRGPVDTLVVPGPAPPLPDRFPPGLVADVRRLGTSARRSTSVCSGAFLLAEAGLLTDRRATTHWALCSELAVRFPVVSVVPDAIFVRDGPVVTSAGVTAGVDMALGLVEDDHGADVARAIARYLIVFLQRPGGQSQFSVWSTTRSARDSALRRVLDAVAAAPAGDHSLAAMAGRARVSERHVTRLFQREIGLTPGQYVLRARLEAARMLLESGDAVMDAVARASGFGSDESMRRAFGQLLGVTPAAYRRRFRTTDSTGGLAAKGSEAMTASFPRRTVLGGAIAAGVLACSSAPSGPAAPADDLSLPATPLATQAHELITDAQLPFLRHHSVRSFLFGRAAAVQTGLLPDRDYDAELMFLICALHDMGLTDRASTDQRFEVDGADFAARFLEERGVTDRRVDTVWEAIALHTTPHIHDSPVFRRRRAPEILVAQAGIGIDVTGAPDRLPPGYPRRVHARYPRLGGIRTTLDAIIAQARANPRKAPPTTLAGETLHQRHPELPYPTMDQILSGAGWGD